MLHVELRSPVTKGPYPHFGIELADFGIESADYSGRIDQLLRGFLSNVYIVVPHTYGRFIKCVCWGSENIPIMKDALGQKTYPC